MINERCVQRYCKDDISKIENYDKAIADPTQTWHLHHRLELTLDGEFAHTHEELKRLGMYYNRPYFELIFMSKSEHRSLHTKGEKHPLYGKNRSAETRRKISESEKGKTAWNKGKHRSEECKRKISESLKGRHHSAETRKKMSETLKGRTSPRKGKVLSAETRKKMSDAHKRRLSHQ